MTEDEMKAMSADEMTQHFMKSMKSIVDKNCLLNGCYYGVINNSTCLVCGSRKTGTETCELDDK